MFMIFTRCVAAFEHHFRLSSRARHVSFRQLKDSEKRHSEKRHSEKRHSVKRHSEKRHSEQSTQAGILGNSRTKNASAVTRHSLVSTREIYVPLNTMSFDGLIIFLLLSNECCF